MKRRRLFGRNINSPYGRACYTRSVPENFVIGMNADLAPL